MPHLKHAALVSLLVLASGGAVAQQCTYACNDQNNPATACWKCERWDPVTRLLTLDITKCGFDKICCPNGLLGSLSCTLGLLGRRRLLQETLTSGGGTTTVQGTGSGGSKNPSTGRRRLHQTTESVELLPSGAVWKICPAVSRECCMKGSVSSCSSGDDYGVCQFTIQHTLFSVCPRAWCSGPLADCSNGCKCPSDTCCNGLICVAPVTSTCKRNGSWCDDQSRCNCPLLLGGLLSPATCQST